MAEVVTVGDVADWIGDDNLAGSSVLETLVDVLEAKLESDTGQEFKAANGTVTDEAYNGSGTRFLTLSKPPTSLDADIKIGLDPDDEDTTIASTDVLVDEDGQRLIYKEGIFPRGLRNTFVSYTHAANAPKIAKLAIMEASAFIWRRRKREHISGGNLGELGDIEMLAARLEFLPVWKNARTQLSLRMFA